MSGGSGRHRCCPVRAKRPREEKRTKTMFRHVRTIIASLPVLAFAAYLSSCGNPPDAEPYLIVSDSAGIEIVDFDLDRVPRYGTVEPEPDWVFGESSDQAGGVPLNDVTDAVLTSDGRVAVVNWSAQEIFLADPGGEPWQRIGGRGGGPGEFDFIKSVSEEDGTVGVHDGGYRRWMTFRDGEFLESRELPRTGVAGPYLPDVVLPDGDAFYIGDAYAPPGSPGGVVIRRLVLVARVEDDVVDTIAVIPGDTGVDKITGVSPLFWGASYAVVKADSGVWLGDSALRELKLWSRSGELRGIVRWRSSDDRMLTRRRIDAFRDRVIEGRPWEYQARIRQNFRKMTFPSEIPAWGALIPGRDGVLWISDYPGPAAEEPFRDPYPAQQWWGVDGTGRPVGRLVSPAGLQVTGFGPDFLVGIHKDSLRVETVRRHRIRKSTDVIRSP